MNVQTLSVLIIGLAGTAVALDVPVEIELNGGEYRHAGHLYFNVGTGERLMTMIDAVGLEGEEEPSTVWEEIWVIGGPATGCPDENMILFYQLDIPGGTPGLNISPELLDWADIPMDTVVDCVQVHWITDHADTDTNSDSFADGVEGFGATWTFWDGMNGRESSLKHTAEPIIDFTFYSLPGEYPPDPATVAFYTADVDLGANSLSFEFGDTDSDMQEAAVHNPRFDLRDNDSDGIPDIDIDQDGLADWGWSLDFTQPGTRDLDNADGDSDSQTGIDGDVNDFAMAGVVYGLAQPGEAIFDPESETWDWVPGPGAPVTEDAFGLIWPNGSYTGPFFFGGFSCDPFMPSADFAIVLYGPKVEGGIKCGDLAGSPDGSPDGILNFADVSAFLVLFAQGDLLVDLAGNPDGSPDGVLNFLDVSAYLELFAAGCP